MEILGILLLVAVAVWLFQNGYAAGKRDGSRKGYGVGFDRGRRSQSSGCLVVFVLALVAASAVHVGCGRSVASPNPSADPVVEEYRLQVNIIDDNYMVVKVRNKGAGGLVRVVVDCSERSYHQERGESGVGRAVRETFSTKAEPPSRIVTDYSPYGNWERVIELRQGETREVEIQLSAHSSWDDLSYSVVAYGVNVEER